MHVEPRIEMLPTRHYVGLGTVFITICSPDSDSHTVLPRLWDAFLERQGELRTRIGYGAYGLCYALPADSEPRHVDAAGYLACVEVADPSDVPPGMELRTVEGGPYAVWTHRGPLADLEGTVRALYGQWLPASGHTVRDAPDVEIYDERFDPASPDSVFDIAVPIQG